jgi:sensor histidine kinase YesM
MLALSFSIPVLALAILGVPIPAAHAMLHALYAIASLLIVLGADEAVKRGARLRYVNTLATLSLLFGNLLIAAIAQQYFGFEFTKRPVPPGMSLVSIIPFALDQSLWGVLALFVYLNRHIAQRMLQGVQETESRRIRQETELVESRLAAARSQVDPKLLFVDLAEIRDKLDVDAADADERLEALIQRLRSALARTDLGDEPAVDRS